MKRLFAVIAFILLAQFANAQCGRTTFNPFTSKLDCLGTNPTGVANGGTGTTTAFTLGSMVFAGASGVYSQDNANAFWDGTNHTGGFGTTRTGAISATNPTFRVQGSGTTNATSNFEVRNSTPTSLFLMLDDGTWAFNGAAGFSGNFNSTNASAGFSMTPSGGDAYVFGAGQAAANDFGIRNSTRSANYLLFTGGATPYANMNILQKGTVNTCTFNFTTAQFTLAASPLSMCSPVYTLPNVAVTWAYECNFTWSNDAGTTPTLTFGQTFTQAPSAANEWQNILTTNTGTSIQASQAVTTNSNMTATGTLTTSATKFQASLGGTFTASATSGTFSPTATLTGTGATGTLRGWCSIF